jgi:3-carboxy-cis,cis-muconate cycloisomerase
MADALLDRLFGAPAMQAIFDERGRLQGMLDFEAALARVEARLGLIPPGAAEAIAACCRAERFDIEVLGRDALLAGNTAIPLVRQLTRIVAEQDVTAATHVHFGATSQDAMDTGLVLQVRSALDWLQPALERLAAAAAEQAERHRDTVLPGRTWMQHALPITFGLKIAGWLDALERHRQRLAELRPRVLVLQFGGAAGTLAGLHPRGPAVAQALAAELRLALPVLPWHTQRDRIAEMGAALALLVGTLGKIARDVSLLMQTDVGEAFEPAAPGKGGSSSMPHKRNPVSSAVVLAAAVRAPGLAATLLAAMVQEHERGLGGWHAEWTALPELFDLAAGALEHMHQVVAGLEVDAARMRANLDATQGQILAEAVKMALVPHLGAPQAHALVEQACRSAAEQRRHLREILGADARVTAALPGETLERLFDPAQYLGASAELVAGALAAYRLGR